MNIFSETVVHLPNKYQDYQQNVDLDCQYYIIDTGNYDERKGLSLYFSIDFEPVKLLLNREILNILTYSHTESLFKKDILQILLDFSCEILGKEKREVFHFYNNERMKFDENVWEYFAPFRGGRYWAFKTKTCLFYKFYSAFKSIHGKYYPLPTYKEELKYNDSGNFYIHYENVYTKLCEQGLAIGHSYHSPSNETIDILINKILKK